ncbi:type I secretion protein [Mesobaculum littorinae]|uniref:Type I secretion protein n=1 Tax=Mesobaculum littorinae TaxID=2486419 RepID=A0A438ALD5_9RHOB|nr:Hint domain-containing protein [Mesobaculum littorinae]RVV99661.1 type I secretion protein [Mesobaculum littorinae]
MSDYLLDWTHASADGTTTLSHDGSDVNVTVSTPRNHDGDEFEKASARAWDCDDALKASCVDEPVRACITFDQPVDNVSFELFDVDSRPCLWDERVTVIAKDAHGNPVEVKFSDLASHHVVNGGTVDATGAVGYGVDGPGAADSVTVTIPGEITSLEIVFEDGSAASHTGTIGVSDISFDRACADLDGYVEGTDGDDLIDDAYLGDPEGDRIDANDAILPGDAPNDDVVLAGDGDDTVFADAGDDEIYGGAGDDYLDSAEGFDTVYGGGGSDTIDGGDQNDTLIGGGPDNLGQGGPVTITINGGNSAYSNDVFVYEIDPDTGRISNVQMLGTEGRDNGESYSVSVTPGAVIGVGIVTDRGDHYYSSGYGDNLGLNRDGLLHTRGEGVNPDGSVNIGFEDLRYGGDRDFDDARLTINLGDSGARFDNAHYDYDSTIGGPGYSADGGDLIAGELGDDYIDGGDGDDTLDGGEGNDTILGGAGNDAIEGVGGDDLIFGGEGADSIDAGGGNDSVDGGAGRDLIDGGAGDDSITGGADSDTIYGGAGNDWIDGGDGGDSIEGGDGNDTIIGGQDIDTIHGGCGDDQITGGDGLDYLYGDEGNDTIEAGRGGDFVYGGAGNDSLIGASGPDELYGEDGDDTIIADSADDYIDGGAGNDSLDGGTGDDTILGGDGEDRITTGRGNDHVDAGFDADYIGGVNAGDTILGGSGFNAGSADHDVLDLSGSLGGNSYRLDGVTTDSDGNGIDGDVVYFDDHGNETGRLHFENIEEIIPCFTPGARIATPRGERLVEDLREGDRIITRDNGIQEIRWVGRKQLGYQELQQNRHLKPVLIKAGALGHGLPERDMLVSPNHRVLVASDRTQLYFEEREVLVAAKHLVNADTIRSVETLGTHYIHFMFDRHEVVLSDGSWTESFQPGDYTLGGIGNAQRAEILELFPELDAPEGIENYAAARRTLKRHEARLLVD